MEIQTYTYLKFVHFQNIQEWSVQFILNKLIKYNNSFPLACIGSFLHRNKTLINVQNDEIYKRPTIRTNNGGICLRDEIEGKQIGTKKQFLIKEGQFLLSKIDARNGAFGVVPSDCNNAIITGNFWTFDVDYSQINPHFLSLVTTTKAFISFAERASNGTTNRHYLQEDKFLNEQIPLPSLSEQNALVSAYNKKIQQAETLEKKAIEAEENIEKYLVESLGIKLEYIQKHDNKNGFLQMVRFRNIERWDMYNSDNSVFTNLKSCIYPIVKIGTRYKFICRHWEKNTTSFRYVEIGSVDPLHGIVHVEELQTAKAPSRATQIIKEGDLIIGTTRPYLKKFAIVNSLHDDCVCSSGFQVITQNDTYNLSFLYEFLMSSIAVAQFEYYMTGALYPAITNNDLKEIMIPFPPLPVQNEIVSHINKLKEQIKELKQKALELRETALSEFEKEIFE